MKFKLKLYLFLIILVSSSVLLNSKVVDADFTYPELNKFQAENFVPLPANDNFPGYGNADGDRFLKIDKNLISAKVRGSSVSSHELKNDASKALLLVYKRFKNGLASAANKAALAFNSLAKMKAPDVYNKLAGSVRPDNFSQTSVANEVGFNSFGAGINSTIESAKNLFSLKNKKSAGEISKFDNEASRELAAGYEKLKIKLADAAVKTFSAFKGVESYVKSFSNFLTDAGSRSKDKFLALASEVKNIFPVSNIIPNPPAEVSSPAALSSPPEIHIPGLILPKLSGVSVKAKKSGEANKPPTVIVQKTVEVHDLGVSPGVAAELANLEAAFLGLINKQKQDREDILHAVSLTNRIYVLPSPTISNPTITGTIDGLTDDSIPNDITISSSKSITTTGTFSSTASAGTSSIAANFQAGTTTITGSLSVNGLGGTSTVAGNFNVDGNLRVGGICFSCGGVQAVAGWTDLGTRIELTAAADLLTIGTSTAVSGAGVTIEATTTTASPLALRATSGQTGDLLQFRNSSDSKLAYVNSAGGIFGSSTLQIGGSSIFYGNVGIGTTTPSALLAVQGNLLLSGDITNVANIIATGTITSTGATTTNLSVTNAVNITGALTVTGLSTLSGGVLVNNSTSTITNLTTINATSTNATTTNLAITATASTSVLIVSHPTATSTVQAGLSIGLLNVTRTNATSTFANGLTLTAGCFSINGTCLSSGSGSGTVNNGTAGQVAFYASDGTAVSGTSTIFVSTNSRVGVGTTTPASIFAIHGSIYISDAITNVSNITATGTITASGATTTNLAVTNAANITGLATISGGVLVNNSTSTITNLTMINSTTTNATTTYLSIANLASTSKLIVSNPITVNGAGTSTFAGGISAAGLASSQGLTLTGGALSALSFPGTLSALGVGTGTPGTTLGVQGGLLISGQTSIAGLTATGTSILALASGTSVGVGTGTPAKTFSVQGDTYISGSTTVSGLTATSSVYLATVSGSVNIGTTTALVNASTSSSLSPVLIVAGSASTTIFIDSNSPTTTNAVSALAFTINGVGTSSIQVNPNTTDGLTFTTGGILTGANTRLVIRSSGAVGVGTTSPSALLAVQGNLLLSGDITNVANVTATGTITSSGATTTNLAVTNAVNVTGALTVTGLATLSGGVLVNNSTSTITNLTIINATTTNATTTNLAITATASTSVLIVNHPTATSTVQAGLSIGLLNVTRTNATSTFANGLTLTAGCFSINGTCIVTGGAGGSGTVNSGSAGQVAFYASTGTAVSGTSTITITASSTVGIGTTSPFAVLAVQGDGSNNVFAVSTGSPSRAPSSAFLIDKNGNIGIGTDTPAYNFTVAKKTSVFNAGVDGSLPVWTINVNALAAQQRHGTIVANGYIYVMGGWNGGNTSAIYYAKVKSDGSIGTWVTNAISLPTVLQHFGIVTANGFVYTIGGNTAADAGGGDTSAVTTVSYAKLNPDGSIGSWTSTTALPSARARLASVTANGYVYALAGHADGGAVQSTVYYAKLNSDGTVGAWFSANSLPAVRNNHASLVANGFVYAIGGASAFGSTAASTVYYATLNADGSLGSWQTSTNAMPDGTFAHTVTTVNGYVYSIAGIDSLGNPISKVYYAKLKSDGSTEVWATNSNSLPATVYGLTSAVVNGYVYALLGNSSSGNIYYSSTARVLVSGALDLIGLSSTTVTGVGDQGSTLYAGNIFSSNNLEVSGNAQLWNGLAVNGLLTLSASTSLAQTSSIFTVKNATSTDPLFTILYNGSVGFGTTTPSQTLSVQGNSLISGTTTVGGLIATGTTQTNTLSVTGTASTSVLVVSHPTATSTIQAGLNIGLLNVTRTNATSTFANGITLTAGCFSINGTCLATGGGGSGTVNSGNIGQVAFYSSTGTTVSGTSTITITSTSTVGVGTTSPWARLSVQGINYDTTNIFAVATSTSVTTATALLVNARGYVAIGGTSTPSEQLTVQGNIANLIGSSTNPTIFSNMTVRGATGIFVAGRYAYVTDQTDGSLQIFDVSSTTPALVSSTTIAATPVSVYVAGKYAYVANQGGASAGKALQIIDISNPNKPDIRGSAGTATSPTSVYVSGRYAYIINNSTPKLEIYDVTNVSAPLLVKSVALSTNPVLAGPKSIVVQGRYAYIAEYNATKLQIFDVSNPYTAVSAGTVTVTGNPRGVAVSGRYAYIVTDTPGTLQVIDIANASSPSVLSTYVLNGIPTSLYVAGRYAYVAGSINLQIVDISNPASPLGLVSYAVPANTFNDIFVAGRYIYTTSGSGSTASLPIYDASGFETTSAIIHSLEAGNLQVRNDVSIVGQLSVYSGINVGAGGIYSDGSISVVASTTNAGAVSASFGNLVAIGTTSPYARLSVFGSGTGAGQLFELANSASTTILMVLENGKVGVGTTSPSAAFSVQGDALISGTTTIANIIATGTVQIVGPNSTTTILNALAVGTTTARTKLSIDGQAYSHENGRAATTTINWSQGNQQVIIATSSGMKITLDNGFPGGAYRLILCQDSTGSRTVSTWDPNILWSGGTAPTLTTTANKCDVISFIYTNGTSTTRYFGASTLNF